MAARPVFLALATAGAVAVALACVEFSGASFTASTPNPSNAFGSGQLTTPSPLTCAWTGTNSLQLTWTQTSALASGYVVERSDSPGSGYATLTTTGSGATVTASDSNPLPPTLRYYRVKSTVGTQWSSPTTPVSASNTCSLSVLPIASITDPVGVAVDASGNVYTSSSNDDKVYKTTPGGVTTTYAGTGVGGYSGNGGAATSAQLNNPKDLAIDASGNLYFAEEVNDVVRKVTPGGIISTVAGNGLAGYSGDGGAATSARLNGPYGLHVTSDGTIYVADSGNDVVRKITPGGTISTFAGTGATGFSGDGGAATSAVFNFPYDVITDSAGNVYIADTNNDAIRKVTLGGTISTIAGRGANAACTYSGAASGVDLTQPKRMAYDPTTDRIFVPDNTHNCIRSITGGSTVALVAGTGTASSTGDNGPAVGATINGPLSTFYWSSTGELYFGEVGNEVRKILDV